MASALSKQTSVAGIILAAGKGTRMRSATPKVLHKLAGLTMLDWVFDVTKAAGVGDICVVLSEELDGFKGFLHDHADISVTTQKNRQGTGDAAAAAALAFSGVKRAAFAAGRLVQGGNLDATHVLLMAGDVPAVNPLSLKDFVDSSLSAKAPLSVLGMEVPEPRGYGRLVSNGDELVKIVEEKDADDETRRITVVSSGVIFAETKLLFELLAELRPNNAQKEFYLTDTIGLCHARGQRPRFYVAKDWQYFSGINDRQQLASVEALIIRRKLEELMHGGVTIRQPASCYIEAKVEVGVDSEISAGVKLYGKTRLGSKCVLEANVVLEQVTCGDGVLIGAGAVLKNCEIARGDIVPPGTVRIGL